MPAALQALEAAAVAGVSRRSARYERSKRIFDATAAAAGLALLLPLLLAIGLLIRVSSRGPAIFTQHRSGQGGSVFTIYKFRTLHQDAADRTGRHQVRPSDRRVTPLGRFLRATRLDELPQLWNVLKGEMSLVGPRPYPLQMTVEGRPYRDLSASYEARHLVKPGITGLAQVCGHCGPLHSVREAEERLAHDLLYVRQASLALDLLIVMRTILGFAREQKSPVPSVASAADRGLVEI